VNIAGATIAGAAPLAADLVREFGRRGDRALRMAHRCANRRRW
jgi:hypothetical protein